MSTVVTARNASADPGAFRYQRHRPEKTLLYQLVLKHYPVFKQQLAEEGRALSGYVQREFEDYLTTESPLAFRRLPSPNHGELQRLVNTISRWVGAYLEGEGLLIRDMDDTYLQLDHASGSALGDLIGHSITYRIALGPGAGRKAFTLQTVPARQDEDENR